MNDKDQVKEFLELYEDIYAANQMVAIVCGLSIVSITMTAVLMASALLISVPLCGFLGLAATKIKLDQKKKLNAMGLNSKDLTRMKKSGEIDRLYDFVNSNTDVQSVETVVENFDYIPSKESSISRTSIYLNKPKKNENDKSNEI